MSRVFKGYTYTIDTHELLGPCDIYTDETHDMLPFHTEKKPLDKRQGFAVVFNEQSQEWEYQEDHRGLVLFNTKNRQSVTIEKLGKVPKYLTPLAPKSEYDVWDGEKWVIYNQALKADQINTANQTKARLAYEAESKITLLERKVRLEMATDSEKALLRSWEIYSINLDDIDTSTAPDINWPTKPQKK